jgi:hypothetical protein
LQLSITPVREALKLPEIDQRAVQREGGGAARFRLPKRIDNTPRSSDLILCR